jgi:hypothetical protein
MTPMELYRKQKLEKEKLDKEVTTIAKIDNSFIDSFLRENKAVTMKMLLYIAKSNRKLSSFKKKCSDMKYRVSLHIRQKCDKEF